MDDSLRPIPMGELFEALGCKNSSKKYSDSKKKNQVDSPLVLKPMEEVRQMLLQHLASNSKKFAECPVTTFDRNIKKVPKMEQNAITFKVPKRVSLSSNNYKGNSRASISSAKRANKRATTICTQEAYIHPKPASKVKKVLFSGMGTPKLHSKPIKTINHKPSLIPGTSLNAFKETSIRKRQSATETPKPSIKVTIATPTSHKKENPLKLSSNSIDDFELAEAFFNLQSPSAVETYKNDFHYMQELVKKHQALSAQMNTLSKEMSKVWGRIHSQYVKACTKKNSKRSPFPKSASVKKTNLLKTTLLKTVKESLSTEESEVPASTNSTEIVVEAAPVDFKMSECISMYNAMPMRGHMLRTPKISRRSLEHGDSISTTVQKQCLMLMDTPKH